MKRPAFPKISTNILQSIAERHDLDARTFSRLPEIGIFNAIYALGSDIILRIPRNHPAFTAAARKEDVAPLDNDETGEARILWRHLQLALLNLRRGPLPQRSWAERPMTMLLEIMRFLIEAPGKPWASLVQL